MSTVDLSAAMSISMPSPVLAEMRMGAGESVVEGLDVVSAPDVSLFKSDLVIIRYIFLSSSDPESIIPSSANTPSSLSQRTTRALRNACSVRRIPICSNRSSVWRIPAVS